MLLAGKRLDDTQIKEFHDALHGAFRPESLEHMFYINMGKQLEDIILLRSIGFTTVVSKVIEQAEEESWTAQLLQAALSVRHDDIQLAAFAQQFGPVIKTPPLMELRRAIELQRAIRPDVPTYDFDDLIRHLYELAGRVCSIEDIYGAHFGTGFLVRPDTIMTNYHVWEAIQDPEDVRCCFDHRTTTEKVPYPLAQGEKCEIDVSRYNPGEDDPNGKTVIPSPEELDYAILRLADSPGDKPIGDANQPDAPKRGWITPYMREYPFPIGTPLFILHHPQKSDGDGTSETLQVSLETYAIKELNENKTRVRYKTNTQRGSSGAPCFTADWKLVALHHAGDLNPRPEYNQGIPFKAILDHLEKGDHKDIFPKSLFLVKNSTKNAEESDNTRSVSRPYNQGKSSIKEQSHTVRLETGLPVPSSSNPGSPTKNEVPIDRNVVLDLLYDSPSGIFAKVCAYCHPPAGVLSSGEAHQTKRANELVEWAEGIGPGLSTLHDYYLRAIGKKKP